MQTEKLFSNQKANSYFELDASQKINISGVFADRTHSYLNEFNLFLAHFNYIPNFTYELNINCLKANLWFLEQYQSEIKDNYYTKLYLNRSSKQATLDDIFYFLFDDLIVYFDTQQSVVRFLYRKTEIEKVESIIAAIRKFKKSKKKQMPEISLLLNGTVGIETRTLQITKPKLKIEDNYNDDFVAIHQTIIKSLAKKNNKGLVLLHGKPGTGKTSYIRYLVASVKKDVIFLPPDMASAITHPSLISILIDNPNSIFVIEDAENIVVDREQDGRSPVSAILNISDGLLADCLNVQIICSFNTDISKIDSALLRKGRLIAKYEFKELDTEKAQQLSNKLGFEKVVNTPMTLSNIYNQGDMDFQKQKSKPIIGFRMVEELF